MEDATEKRKRGRPSVMERSEGTMVVDSIAQSDTRNQTHRTHTNQAYVYAGSYFVGEHYAEISHADALVYQSGDIYLPQKTRQAVLEQIGRAAEQDHFGEEDILALSIYAAAMINGGYTVKQAANWLRKVRKEGFTGNPTIWEAATDISLTYKEMALTGKYLEILRDILDLMEQEELSNRKSPITERFGKFFADYGESKDALRQILRKIDAKLE